DVAEEHALPIRPGVAVNFQPSPGSDARFQLDLERRPIRHRGAAPLFKPRVCKVGNRRAELQPDQLTGGRPDPGDDRIVHRGYDALAVDRAVALVDPGQNAGKLRIRRAEGDLVSLEMVDIDGRAEPITPFTGVRNRMQTSHEPA